jgi:hypothetical protein
MEMPIPYSVYSKIQTKSNGTYFLSFSNSGTTLYKGNGFGTWIASSPNVKLSSTSYDEIEVIQFGDKLKINLNNENIFLKDGANGQITDGFIEDNTYTSGYISICPDNTTVYVDDISIEKLSEDPFVVPVIPDKDINANVDFDNTGVPNKWTVNGLTVANEGNNKILKTTSFGWQTLLFNNNMPATNYEMDMKVRRDEFGDGGCLLFFLRQDVNETETGIKTNRIILDPQGYRSYSSDNNTPDATGMYSFLQSNANISIDDGNWHDISIISYGDRTIIMQDGKRALDFLNPKYQSGLLYLACYNAKASFDNIKIQELQSNPFVEGFDTFITKSDFESSIPKSWVVDGYSIFNDNENKVFKSNDNGDIVFNEYSPARNFDFNISFKGKTLSDTGCMNIILKANVENNVKEEYIIKIEANQISAILNKNNVITPLANAQKAYLDEGWHSLKITYNDGVCYVVVDKNLILNFYDDTILEGKVELQNEDAALLVDNIELNLPTGFEESYQYAQDYNFVKDVGNVANADTADHFKFYLVFVIVAMFILSLISRKLKA